MFLPTNTAFRGMGAACDPTTDPNCLANLDPSSFDSPVGSTSAGTVAADVGTAASVNSQLSLMSLLNSIIPQSSGTNKPVSSTPTWAFPALVVLLGVVALAGISGGHRR